MRDPKPRKTTPAELARIRARIDAEEAAELEALKASSDATAHRPEGSERFFGLHGDYQGDA